MPQLDFSFYISQVFSTLVSFFFLLLAVQIFIIPKMERIFSLRSKQIEEDLLATKEAQKKMQELLLKIRGEEERAHVKISEIFAGEDIKLARYIKEENEALDLRIKGKVVEAELEIDQSRKLYITQLDRIVLAHVEFLINKLTELSFSTEFFLKKQGN